MTKNENQKIHFSPTNVRKKIAENEMISPSSVTELFKDMSWKGSDYEQTKIIKNTKEKRKKKLDKK